MTPTLSDWLCLILSSLILSTKCLCQGYCMWTGFSEALHKMEVYYSTEEEFTSNPLCDFTVSKVQWPFPTTGIFVMTSLPFADTVSLGFYLLPETFICFLSFLVFSLLPSYSPNITTTSKAAEITWLVIGATKINHTQWCRIVFLQLVLFLPSPSILGSSCTTKAHQNFLSNKKAHFPLRWILLLSQKIE